MVSARQRPSTTLFAGGTSASASAPASRALAERRAEPDELGVGNREVRRRRRLARHREGVGEAQRAAADGVRQPPAPDDARARAQGQVGRQHQRDPRLRRRHGVAPSRAVEDPAVLLEHRVELQQVARPAGLLGRDGRVRRSERQMLRIEHQVDSRHDPLRRRAAPGTGPAPRAAAAAAWRERSGRGPRHPRGEVRRRPQRIREELRRAPLLARRPDSGDLVQELGLGAAELEVEALGEEAGPFVVLPVLHQDLHVVRVEVQLAVLARVPEPPFEARLRLEEEDVEVRAATGGSGVAPRGPPRSGFAGLGSSRPRSAGRWRHSRASGARAERRARTPSASADPAACRRAGRRGRAAVRCRRAARSRPSPGGDRRGSRRRRRRAPPRRERERRAALRPEKEARPVLDQLPVRLGPAGGRRGLGSRPGERGERHRQQGRNACASSQLQSPFRAGGRVQRWCQRPGGRDRSARRGALSPPGDAPVPAGRRARASSCPPPPSSQPPLRGAARGCGSRSERP